MARGHLRERLLNNATGLPIANAVVTVREPGTTTVLGATMYAALTGGTTKANPITTGVDGVVDFYLDVPQDVDLRVVAAGFTTTTIASIKALYAQTDLVDKASTQTITGQKTLTSPILNTPTITSPSISSPTFSTPVLAPDGTISNPGIGFASEPGLGFRRVSNNHGALAVNTLDAIRFRSNVFGPEINIGNIGYGGSGQGPFFHVHHVQTAANDGVIGIHSEITNDATASITPGGTPDSAAATFVVYQSSNTALGAMRSLEVHTVRAYSGAGSGVNDAALAAEVGIHTAAAGNPGYTSGGTINPKTYGIWSRSDADALIQFLGNAAVRADCNFWSSGAAGFRTHYRATDTDGTTIFYADQNGSVATAGTHGFISDLGNGMYKITTNTLGFKTNSSEAVRINSTQDVGIGGSAPAGTRLYVAGGLIEANGGVKNSASLTLTSVISPTALSGTTNDWNPTGLSTATAIRVSLGGVNRDLTGIVAQPAGRVLFLTNTDAGNLTLKNNTGSSAANRFFTPAGGADFPITTNGCCILWYDGTSSCWRVMSAASASG